MKQVGNNQEVRIDGNERERVLTEIINHLENKYVLTDKVDAFVERLNTSSRSGKYDTADPVELAELIDNDLQEVYPDKHLKFTYFNEATQQISGLNRARKVMKKVGDDSQIPSGAKVVRLPKKGRKSLENDTNSSIEETASITEKRKNPQMSKISWHEATGLHSYEVLDNNIGFIRIDLFRPLDDEEKKKYLEACQAVVDTDILIIDLRFCRGGTPESISYLSSFLFGDEKILLAKTYFRETDETIERWTHGWEESFGSYTGKPVYVLTSNFTGSGGESFAYSLQHRGRATLVGETTAGAGLMVEMVDIGNNFQLNVSIGRTFNPDNRVGFEFTGVQPDIEFPADLALDETLKLIEQNM